MFILRRISKDGLEINTSLGSYYVLVYAETNKNEFEDTIKLWSEEDRAGIYAIITYNDGADIMPLYDGSNYYIMTGEGKTFDNITKR